MGDAHLEQGRSSKSSQWDGSPSALTPEGEIRVFERYAESPRASRSRRARIGWAVFFTLMVVPVLIAISAWVLKLLS